MVEGLYKVIGGRIMGSVISIIFGILMLITNIENYTTGGIITAFLFIGIGAFNLFGRYVVHKDQVETQNIKQERSKQVIDTLGGVQNIDIDLGKYSNEVQLIVLKDKRICIGRSNYTNKKIINFESIIKVEIVIDNIKEQVEKLVSIRDKKYSQEIIRSISVYIHTDSSTEELIYRYSDFMTEQAQINFNEILKGIKRFKIIVEELNDKQIIELDTKVEEQSNLEKIKELKGLLDIDAITQEEFDSKKAELLKYL